MNTLTELLNFLRDKKPLDLQRKWEDDAAFRMKLRLLELDETNKERNDNR